MLSTRTGESPPYLNPVADFSPAINLPTLGLRVMNSPQITPALAHELRSPLAAVVGTIDVLVDAWDSLEREELVELLGIARSEAAHLMQLVEHARRGSDERGPVVLADVARRALERFPDVEARTYVRFDRRVVAWSDHNRVDQIVTNLFQNIERYAPEGDVELTVHDSGSVVELLCRDSGPGIPPEQADSIFSERSGGSGRGLHVGLALSRRIAQDLDGDLELAGGDGPGASFRLTLPAASTGVVAGAGEISARTPRARMLIDIADAVLEPSPGRIEIGLQRLATTLLDAVSVRLLTRRGDRFHPLTESSLTAGIPSTELGIIHPGSAIEVRGADWWRPLTGTEHGIAIRLNSGAVETVLVVGLPTDSTVSTDSPVLRSLGVVAGLAVERSMLSEELERQRQFQTLVLESLPIAVSVFAGDPPVLVAENAAERRLLGIEKDEERPYNLDSSQRVFDVRFADGTPLTVENAPVTEAIRQGRRNGPIFLKLTRSDGTEVFTRTYCVPFQGVGGMTGAIVTSEPVEHPLIESVSTFLASGRGETPSPTLDR